MKSVKNLKWVPKEGLYQCVIPNGKVHIDMYIDGRNPEPITLNPGQEVELYERELRTLKRSEILEMGYLAPLFYYEKDKEGNTIQVSADGDPDNPNVINDDAIYMLVQKFKNAEMLIKHISEITSALTISRFKHACTLLDTPQSYLTAIDERLQEIADVDTKQMYSGRVSAQRKSLLTAKIER